MLTLSRNQDWKTNGLMIGNHYVKLIAVGDGYVQLDIMFQGVEGRWYSVWGELTLESEPLILGNTAEINLVKIDRSWAHIGIDAPKDIDIVRCELLDDAQVKKIEPLLSHNMTNGKTYDNIIGA